MTTWAYPVHSMHPWFRSPSLKRKASSSDEDDDLPTTVHGLSVNSDSPVSPVKRRRCDILEHGIAHLSLNTAAGIRVLSAPPSKVDAPQVESATEEVFASPIPLSTSSSEALSSPTYTFVQRPLSGAVRPDLVEEPQSPDAFLGDVEDVPMASGSWYEVEKDRKCPNS